MPALAALRTAPSALSLASVRVDAQLQDVRRIAIPVAQVRLVVRLGAALPHGLDVHAMGVRQTAKRKSVPRGLRAVIARLKLGTSEAVLGVSAAALAGHHVSLEELWDSGSYQRLCARLHDARDLDAAAAVLESAIAERTQRAAGFNARNRLAQQAATQLSGASVSEVASALGVSERHLRRTFHDSVGVSPKAYAKLARFHRALDEARTQSTPSWANIAASTGYYDQAHLISEFRAITGTTPRALLRELRESALLG